MAIQTGILKLQGRIGDLSFFTSAYGDMVRRAAGPTGEQIKKNPAFKETRKHLADFARTGKATKLTRAAFATQFKGVADPKMTNRMIKNYWSVITSDVTNRPGRRQIMDGDVALMTGFEFNKQASLRAIFNVAFVCSLNRKTGKMDIDIPAFLPLERVKRPEASTHFKLTAVAAEIDFKTEKVKTAMSEGALLAFESLLLPPMKLSVVLNRTSKPLLLSLGIQYFQVVNGKPHLLYNSMYNGLCLVHVERGVETKELPNGKSGMAKRFGDRVSKRMTTKKRTR